MQHARREVLAARARPHKARHERTWPRREKSGAGPAGTRAGAGDMGQRRGRERREREREREREHWTRGARARATPRTPRAQRRLSVLHQGSRKRAELTGQRGPIQLTLECFLAVNGDGTNSGSGRGRADQGQTAAQWPGQTSRPSPPMSGLRQSEPSHHQHGVWDRFGNDSSPGKVCPSFGFCGQTVMVAVTVTVTVARPIDTQMVLLC